MKNKDHKLQNVIDDIAETGIVSNQYSKYFSGKDIKMIELTAKEQSPEKLACQIERLLDRNTLKLNSKSSIDSALISDIRYLIDVYDMSSMCEQGKECAYIMERRLEQAMTARFGKFQIIELGDKGMICVDSWTNLTDIALID